MFGNLIIRYFSNNTQLNSPTTSGDVISTIDIAGVKHQTVVNEFGDGAGGVTQVAAATPMPVIDASAISNLVSILAKLSSDPATQTTLAAILAKLIAAPATAANQATEIASLASIDTKLTSPITVTGIVATGGLTDTQLRASAVPISNANLDVLLSTRLKAADTLAAVTLISDIRQATAGNLNMTEASAAAIKTAVETIDNFISGSRGLVTEDNSASIKTAVETIDNFISGSRGLVTEDNSASILAVEGATADAIVAAGAVGSISAKLRRATQGLEDLKTLIVLAAGSNIIGKVGIDQTTPGTTNAVQANAGTNLNTSLLALETGGNLAAIAASASVLDDWDETDRAKVNQIVGQAGVAAGSGLVSSTTQRVTLATDVDTPNFPIVDGKRLPEIMSQVLLELRILNQMFSELPVVLSSKTGRFEEPNKLRNEQTIFSE